MVQRCVGSDKNKSIEDREKKLFDDVTKSSADNTYMTFQLVYSAIVINRSRARYSPAFLSFVAVVNEK